jgi:hypothetical protein
MQDANDGVRRLKSNAAEWKDGESTSQRPVFEGDRHRRAVAGAQASTRGYRPS